MSPKGAALWESAALDPAAPPIIRKIYKKGVAADPLHDPLETAIGGRLLR